MLIEFVFEFWDEANGFLEFVDVFVFIVFVCVVVFVLLFCFVVFVLFLLFWFVWVWVLLEVLFGFFAYTLVS